MKIIIIDDDIFVSEALKTILEINEDITVSATGSDGREALELYRKFRPDVLLMDEPFGALDPQTKASMQLLLRQIWQKHRTTVVFVTHDIEEAVFLATKIYVMSARPGTVKTEIPVYLPYDRTLELKDTKEFIDLRREVNSLIHTDDF